jgi:ABC-type antimicrobial peptide transport system permease subunit
VLDGKEYWLDDYTLHALGVGAIITVVLLLVVLIGVYIPARAASRVNPVEALRDE